MHADNHLASIGIEITHPDPGVQELFFLQFTELKTMLGSLMEENWEWKLHTTDAHGQSISRIYKEITPVNVFDREDWPALISFLKPRLIALDEFWTDAKYSFDSLK